MHRMNIIAPLLALLLLPAGCAGSVTDEAAFSSHSEILYTRTATDEEAFGFLEETENADIRNEAPAELSPHPAENVPIPAAEELPFEWAVPLADAPMLLPVAAGSAAKSGGGAEIDYSNTADGYVMARFVAANSKRLRVQIAGPGTTYLYDLPTGGWVTFPLSDGDGSYKVTVLQNTEGKKYAILVSVTFQVTLTDEFAPFLRPNQYVDYAGAANSVAKAAELTQNACDDLDKVARVYNFVVGNLTYDRAKAESVQSGYLPVLDTVLAAQKGICFDYAALMAGMLRSQGVPCKLVVGYAGAQYHAWVSVWTEETGWIDGAIYFDGTAWHRMDPTFASSGNSSEAIMKYIGDGKNYTVKYLY